MEEGNFSRPVWNVSQVIGKFPFEEEEKKNWRVFSDNLYMDHGERNVYLQQKKISKD